MIMTCPDTAQLQQLVAGELPAGEEADLIKHIDRCPECPARLEMIAAGNGSLIEAAREASREPLPANSAYWPAVKQLNRDIGQTVAGSSADTTPDDDVALDFLAPTDEPGQLGRLAHYNIVKLIGRGGMGVVLKAFDTHLQRNVALKVMSPELANDETARKRFCREARAAAAITHEHVVAVHNVAHEEGRNVPFLVMQLVNGESLERKLAREGPLPLKEIVRIGMQIAGGLAAAHEQHLIHRDIKPDNILLEAPGDRVKLTDFGLARAAEDVKLTASGLIAGTPAYMSPEQARGEALDQRSDLFSFGSVLYAMATGHPPFDGGNSFVVLRKITEDPAPPIPQIPAWLSDVIARLHAKKPSERFQSAQEVADLLRLQLARLESAEAPALPYCPNKVRKQAQWSLIGAGGAGLALAAALAITEFTGLSHFFGSAPAPAPSATQADDTPSAALRTTLNGSAGTVWSQAFAPDGSTLAMAIDDGTVKVWDVKSGRVVSTLNGHKGPVWSVAYSPDGMLLATASDDATVKLWNPADGQELKTLPHAASVRSIAFGPGNRLLTGSRNGNLRVWDTGSGKELFSTKGHTHTVVSVAFSPDGQSLASASGDKTVKLWDAANGHERLTLQGHSGVVYTVAFSPDNQKVASSGWDKEVRIWDAASGACVATLYGHKQDVWSVAFSPDGRTLASAGEDRHIKIWNLADGKEKAALQGHTAALHGVTFSRDGKLLASGSRDGTVRLWDMSK